jgi:hypothetical protein
MNPAVRQILAQRLSLHGPEPSHAGVARTGTCTVPSPSVVRTAAAKATRFARSIITHLLPGFTAIRTPRGIAAAADAGVAEGAFRQLLERSIRRQTSQEIACHVPPRIGANPVTVGGRGARFAGKRMTIAAPPFAGRRAIRPTRPPRLPCDCRFARGASAAGFRLATT